jgi:3-methyladenine DNA glycosylase AlkD
MFDCAVGIVSATGGYRRRPAWIPESNPGGESKLLPWVVAAAAAIDPVPSTRTSLRHMETQDVLELLEASRNERGIRHWEQAPSGSGGLKSFGIGLIELRKLAKRIGRDHQLARGLWATDVYDAKVISLLIDDPATITRQQAEKQVEELAAGQLTHVFASCDATLARTPFVVELADEWTRSDDVVRRICGYGLLYEISKFTGRKAPDEAYFLGQIAHIAETIHGERSNVRLAMGNALMGMGKRSAKLNAAALAVAEAVGPIEFESASGRCEPFDVVKHLTTARLKEKLRA